MKIEIEKEKEIKITRFPPRPATAKKTLFAKAGNICSFPGCKELLIVDDLLFGNICHISDLHLGGPRYNSKISKVEVFSLDNLIALCATHHTLIDKQPFIYTTEWLKKAKINHEKKIEEAISKSSFTPVGITKISALSFQESLGIWSDNEENGDEEFWQTFFRENPKILAQTVPNHIIKFGQKCYVGGKTISNQGGNLLDFLYANPSNRNVTLIEIKTPLTKLVGSKYRSNAYSLTEELSGSIVQVLNYKDELLKNYHNLCNEEELKFSAFNPQCLIIAGNLNIENLNSIQHKSFELFRSNSTVNIITYNELFGKVSDLIDIVS